MSEVVKEYWKKNWPQEAPRHYEFIETNLGEILSFQFLQIKKKKGNFKLYKKNN